MAATRRRVTITGVAVAFNFWAVRLLEREKNEINNFVNNFSCSVILPWIGIIILILLPFRYGNILPVHVSQLTRLIY